MTATFPAATPSTATNSGRESSVNSPARVAPGALPAPATTRGLPKLPPPAPSRIESVPEPGLATARSVLPSWFQSPAHRKDGLPPAA